MKDGFYKMSFAKYRELDAINWSTLKELENKSLFAFKRLVLDQTQAEISANLEVGTALHAAVLEPETFAESYRVMKSANGVVERQTLKKETPHLAIISKGELDQVLLMRDSLVANESFTKYLTGGNAETVMLWTDPDTGLRCKARLDYFNSEFICDVKTTIEPQSQFGDSAFKYGYIGQAAWYVWGFTMLANRSTDFAFAVVGKNEPYESYFARVTSDQIDYGYHVAKSLLRKYDKAKASNDWPKVEPEIDLTISPWNLKRMNETSLMIKEF